MSDAEDAVQETWLRLSRADTSGVENLTGWLTTVVARVARQPALAGLVRGDFEQTFVGEPFQSDVDGPVSEVGSAGGAPGLEGLADLIAVERAVAEDAEEEQARAAAPAQKYYRFE